MVKKLSAVKTVGRAVASNHAMLQNRMPCSTGPLMTACLLDRNQLMRVHPGQAESPCGMQLDDSTQLSGASIEILLPLHDKSHARMGRMEVVGGAAKLLVDPCNMFCMQAVLIDGHAPSITGAGAPRASATALPCQEHTVALSLAETLRGVIAWVEAGGLAAPGDANGSLVGVAGASGAAAAAALTSAAGVVTGSAMPGDGRGTSPLALPPAAGFGVADPMRGLPALPSSSRPLPAHAANAEPQSATIAVPDPSAPLMLPSATFTAPQAVPSPPAAAAAPGSSVPPQGGHAAAAVAKVVLPKAAPAAAGCIQAASTAATLAAAPTFVPPQAGPAAAGSPQAAPAAGLAAAIPGPTRVMPGMTVELHMLKPTSHTLRLYVWKSVSEGAFGQAFHVEKETTRKRYVLKVALPFNTWVEKNPGLFKAKSCYYRELTASYSFEAQALMPPTSNPNPTISSSSSAGPPDASIVHGNTQKHLLPCHGFGFVHQELPALLLQLCVCTVQDYLEKRGPIEERTALTWTLQVRFGRGLC